MRNAIIAIEDRRFYTNSGVDIRGIGARVRPGRRPAARRAGRLDDHPAVREERAPRAEPAHDLPEAPRGGARLPPDAQVVEGEDPHAVPELDLLRQRRLRDRVGRADVLRQGPPGLRHARRGRCASSVLRPEEAALLAGVVANPSGYDPVAHPVAAERAAQPRPAADVRAGPHHAGCSTSTRARRRSRPIPSRRPSGRPRRTSRPGSASSSSTASARAAPSRAG